MTDQNNVAQPAVVVTLTRTLGAYGAAFDLPGPHRAFTYHHQPGNIGAQRLGSAWQKAASGSSGDLIDRGLGLLKTLQEVGFGVFEVSEIAAPADEQNVLCCDAVMNFRRSDAVFPAHPLPVFSAGKWTYDGTGQSFDYRAMDEAAFSVYRAALASAPVAGEAVGVVHPNGDTFRLTRSLPVGTKVYAAPQAGAEDVRNAALYLLREAREMLPAFTTAEAIGAWSEKVRKFGAGEVIDVPPQAGKDGGQQRAGDVGVTRLLTAAKGMTKLYGNVWDRADGALVVFPENVARFDAAFDALRAAVGELVDDATQPEQGERDEA